MDKQHLKKSHNVYWVRVWVPKPVRGILGKSELWKNLYTTDLAEANTKKHRVVAELMEVIEQAKRDLDGTLDMENLGIPRNHISQLWDTRIVI